MVEQRAVGAFARLLDVVDAAVELVERVLHRRDQLRDGLLALLEIALRALLVLAERLLREIEEHAIVGLQRLARQRLERSLEHGLRFVEQRDLLGGGLALGVEFRDEGGVGLGECVEFGSLLCDGFVCVRELVLEPKDFAVACNDPLAKCRTLLGSGRDAALETRSRLRAREGDGEDADDHEADSQEDDDIHGGPSAAAGGGCDGRPSSPGRCRRPRRRARAGCRRQLPRRPAVRDRRLVAERSSSRITAPW